MKIQKPSDKLRKNMLTEAERTAARKIVPVELPNGADGSSEDSDDMNEAQPEIGGITVYPVKLNKWAIDIRTKDTDKSPKFVFITEPEYTIIKKEGIQNYTYYILSQEFVLGLIKKGKSNFNSKDIEAYWDEIGTGCIASDIPFKAKWENKAFTIELEKSELGDWESLKTGYTGTAPTFKFTGELEPLNNIKYTLKTVNTSLPIQNGAPVGTKTFYELMTRSPKGYATQLEEFLGGKAVRTKVDPVTGDVVQITKAKATGQKMPGVFRSELVHNIISKRTEEEIKNIDKRINEATAVWVPKYRYKIMCEVQAENMQKPYVKPYWDKLNIKWNAQLNNPYVKVSENNITYTGNSDYRDNKSGFYHNNSCSLAFYDVNGVIYNGITGNIHDPKYVLTNSEQDKFLYEMITGEKEVPEGQVIGKIDKTKWVKLLMYKVPFKQNSMPGHLCLITGTSNTLGAVAVKITGATQLFNRFNETDIKNGFTIGTDTDSIKEVSSDSIRILLPETVVNPSEFLKDLKTLSNDLYGKETGYLRSGTDVGAKNKATVPYKPGKSIPDISDAIPAEPEIVQTSKNTTKKANESLIPSFKNFLERLK
jgi:hypothetical protein